MVGAPEYKVWQGMWTRCTNPRQRCYARYGGRGITICPDWRDFARFYADMGPRPPGTTLDRIDVNGNYEPGNCRWATAEEQQRNRRDNHFIECRGERLTLSEWSRRTGLCHSRIQTRLRYGWTAEQALGFVAPPDRPAPKRGADGKFALHPEHLWPVE